MGKANINIKEATERIAAMEKDIAALKELVKNAKERPPRQIPYSLDELVERIGKNGLNEDLVVGDYIDIELYTGEVVRVFITDTEHDEMENGKLADYSLGVTFVDYRVKMNDEDTNATSYKCSKMRKVYLPRLFALLPEVLRNNIVPVKKLTSAGKQSSNIITTVDKIFNFSEVEFYGTNKYSFQGEGKQYKFFENSKNRNVPNYPWLRSPHRGCDFSFCCVYSDGDCDWRNACYSLGVAFGFCLTSKN